MAVTVDAVVAVHPPSTRLCRLHRPPASGSPVWAWLSRAWSHLTARGTCASVWLRTGSSRKKRRALRLEAERSAADARRVGWLPSLGGWLVPGPSLPLPGVEVGGSQRHIRPCMGKAQLKRRYGYEIREIRGQYASKPKVCFCPPELVSPHTRPGRPEVPRTLMRIINSSKLAGRTDGPRDPGYMTVLPCTRYTVLDCCRCVQKLPIPACSVGNVEQSRPEGVQLLTVSTRSLDCRAV